eukprot:gnl/MRDRNA2_/MRDRNA2_97524_c0_seq1.p1 gnl/MRDRNA2_/MRDRNA2_97524_c0~~gnl/MRDRNA2_/MRDRNA2_97524_c0_seq1.p1  ORF type:complete len:443 (+),score=91.39 gnl/MRDRNA2_/MRDRNA2_97524_c0_seq1:94-1422(+)
METQRHYNVLAEGLVHAVLKHREWKFQARQEFGLTIHHDGQHGMSLAKLPVVCVADYLAPILDLQMFEDSEFHHPYLLGPLTELVRSWLSTVDRDPRIHGGMRLFYEDKRLCMAVAELLILSKIYPARAELLPTHNDMSVRDRILEVILLKGMSSLHHVRKEVMLGRKQELMVVIDKFLDVLEGHLKKQSEQPDTMPAALMHLIWQLADLDNNGFFSEDESCELLRFILSRPAFGRLLASVWLQNQKSLWDAIRRVTLTLIIPSVVLCFVKDFRHFLPASKSLWQKLDTDGNHRITKDEFCNGFADAFMEKVITPIINLVAEKLEDALKTSQTKENFVQDRKAVPTKTVQDASMKTCEKTVVQTAMPAKARRSCTVETAEFLNTCYPDDDLRNKARRNKQLENMILENQHPKSELSMPPQFEPILDSERSTKPGCQTTCKMM